MVTKGGAGGRRQKRFLFYNSPDATSSSSSWRMRTCWAARLLLRSKVGTVGRALPNIEVMVQSPETGQECGIGEQGELCCRGYNVMRGYYKMPEATSEVIDADGWLHSGDLAVKDEEGNFRVTGRITDMIIRGGENVYSKEIEDFLYKMPQIKDVQAEVQEGEYAG